MSQERSVNFEYCCRTCLNATSNQMYNIFADINHDLSIADVINKCISINIKKEDRLPKIICNKCYICIKSFHEFCVSAKAVDATFKQHVLNERHIDIGESTDIFKNGSLVNVKKENEDDENNYDIIDIKYEVPYSEDVTKPLNANNNIESIAKLIDSSEISNCKLKCEICNKIFKKLSNFNQHKKKHDAKTKSYTCDVCLKIYKVRKSFVKHLNTHRNNTDSEKCNIEKLQNTEQKCAVCLSMFKSKFALYAHMRKHTRKQKEGRVLSCTICGKVFRTRKYYKQHELRHAENHPFKCSMCPKTFALKSSWKDHVNKHNGIKAYSCPICAKSFTHVRTLSSHIKEIHNEKEKLYQYLCPTCGKIMTTRQQLNEHIRRHQGIKLFACSSCPRKFVSRDGSHRKKSTDKKNSEHPWEGELKSHNITHTGVRAFACEECGAKFTKQTSLARHRVRHLGVKPHQCDTCPMKFMHKDRLKRHYRVHTGEKPYRCDMCECAYSQSNDLDKHRQRVHVGSENLHKCSECPQSFRLKTELRNHLSDHFISKQPDPRLGELAGDPAV